VDGLLRGRLIEATTQPQRQVEPPAPPSRLPAWALGAIPLALIAIALVALLSVGGDTLGERVGPPVEEIAVERTVLRPGEIELSVRNTGPDPVTVSQAFVNDAYADYSTTGNQVGRGGTETFTLDYPWQADSPYLVTLVSETGATTEHEIPVAVETPTASGGFYGLMALLGVYVGIIPVVLGMLFLPLLRQVREHWIRFFMAVTIGPTRLSGCRRLSGRHRDRRVGHRRVRRRGAAVHRRGRRLSRPGRARSLPASAPRPRFCGRDERVPALAAGGDRDRAAQSRRRAGDRLGLRDR
jgi:hypothetical protein